MPQRPDAFSNPKRFYKAAVVGPAAEGGFAVLLDGRAPQTPHHNRLVLPTQALAELVAAEWDVQGEFIMLVDMPATRLANTALDGGQARAAMAAEVARYAGSDLLCYFAEHPRSLVEAEEAGWIPLIEWAEQALGVRFVRARGLTHRAQPDETLAVVEALAAAQDTFSLTGLAFAASLFGSAILAIAQQRGRLDGDGALALSRVDETFQEGRWGVDAEAAALVKRMTTDAGMLDRWFKALA